MRLFASRNKDLVASQLAELHQRSEKPVEVDPFWSVLHQRIGDTADSAGRRKAPSHHWIKMESVRG